MTYHIQVKPVGGEQELVDDGRYYGQTNSGRSSLRWLVRSLELQGKVVLVPDFICQVVIDVLLEFDIRLVFYSVETDLEFTLPQEIECSFDSVAAIYLVRYFGHESKAFQSIINKSNLPIIVDDVFGVDVPNIEALTTWGYFNSLRKISSVADFSQVVSNKCLIDIDPLRLDNYSSLKYKAKHLKSKYIGSEIGQDEDYLKVFSKAESLLDKTFDIFVPESKSVYLAGQFQRNYIREKIHRQRNLEVAKSTLNSSMYINITPDFPSFLPLLIKARDEVRKDLMEHNIFLAVHWPATNQSENQLSNSLMSLPLDTRYTESEVKKVCEVINRLEKKYQNGKNNE